METSLIILILTLSLIAGWFATSGVKSQWIRVLDVLVYGPVLIYAGLKIKEEKWLSVLLLIFGASTMSYNLKNFLTQTN